MSTIPFITKSYYNVKVYDLGSVFFCRKTSDLLAVALYNISHKLIFNRQINGAVEHSSCNSVENQAPADPGNVVHVLKASGHPHCNLLL